MRLAIVCLALGALLPACNSGGKKAAPLPVFAAQRFAGGAVDNEFFPLRPGMRFVLEGDTDDGFVHVEIDVTDSTRLVNGVECVVVEANEYVDGELAEQTFDWYAQDLDGHVWYMGEDSREIEGGLVVSTDGSWEAGVDGAAPGIAMLAVPRIGVLYSQEMAPGVAEDQGKAVALNQTVTTPLGTFEGCLQTEDTNPLDPGAVENKYYARGVGTVLEVEEDGSRVELVSFEYDPPFDPQDFAGGPIDNPLLPLIPGTIRTYEKETEDGLETTVVEVLPDVKVILGVTCTVVRDTVSLDGELVEDTLDWFAQDDEGNVWYLGEDSKEYEGGVLVGTEGSWEAGVDGAEPGVVMFAQPRLFATYRQEFYEGEAEDMATVLALDEIVTVPAGTYGGCLQTEDFTPLEPGISEEKFYAPGVGLVLEVDDEGVRSELVDVEQAP